MKRVLIGCGVGAFLFVAGIVVIVIGGYVLFAPAINKRFDEGSNFGRTTDREGCYREGLRRAEKLGDNAPVIEAASSNLFVVGCLETSSAAPADFCENVPTVLEEITILDENRRYEATTCRKLGFSESNIACRQVVSAKQNFCSTRQSK